MSRNRDGYPSPLSIRDMLAGISMIDSDRAAWSAMGAMTLEGEPLMDQPFRIRTDNTHDSRIAERDSELLILARGLYLDGYRTVAFEKREAPDFTATLDDGRRVAIEVSQVVDQNANWHNNVLTDLDLALKARIDSDPALEPAFTYISFNLEPMSATVPSKGDRETLLDEMVSVLRAKSWPDFERAHAHRALDPRSMLGQYGVWLHFAELPNHPHGHVDVHGGPTSTVPRHGFSRIASERLRAKIAITGAPHFGQNPPLDKDTPLWLVLGIVDPFSVFQRALGEFVAGTKPSAIAPFKRVLLHDWSARVAVDAEPPAAASASAFA